MVQANRQRKFFSNVKVLWLEQMMEIRAAWYWYLLFSLGLPLTMIFGFGRFGQGLNDRSSVLYIISGAAVFAVVNDGLYAVAIRMATMRREGMLVYYASLPISRTAFVVALVFSRLMVLVPAMIFPLVVGPLLYGIHFSFSLWLLVLTPLIALSMSGIGLVIGLAANSLEIANWIVTAILFAVVMVAPVFIPWSSLPLPLQIVSFIFPPTYAADAVRHVLSADIGQAFFLDVGVLCAMVAGSFFAFEHWGFWRLD